MVLVQSFRCEWCGARGHKEIDCKQNKKGILPNVNKLRGAICNNILKKHVYRKHFKLWKKASGIKEKTTWVSAVTTKNTDSKIIKKYFWMWCTNVYERQLENCRGLRWADID